MLDILAGRSTWLHRVNPSFKLLVSMVAFIVVLFTHNINVLLHITWMYTVLLFAASGQPARRLLLILLPFGLLFVSSAVSMVLFGTGETVWYQYGLIRISEESFFRGLHLGFKTVDAALVGLLFALTTNPVQLFYSMMQQLRLPAKYAYSFLAAIRLMGLSVGEYRTLRAAFLVRGVKTRRGLRGFGESVKRYAIPLLAQSIRRAQRTAVAMEAKRFASGAARTYYYRVGWSGSDAALAAVMLSLWGCAWWLAAQVPPFDITDVR
ncbi:energy-coupling factor transport system permease protein [Paenibacillus sp. UNCCL117]|uniref:energy-coupling factor transporter transmembrane component T family protein n=1 Tax=unclassified Paenibacillus TaxID=185978 RepID=UPI00087E302B|nr:MULTISPECIES: energy-coupling factor transporter transmembrane component T [unclassified Paenibacillus]SDD31874.1 energy-coupling factor transport system permease protein [Paenibacillus sp. cl123]SFW39992.1 energy-coupling factor transport system permease protein [Paenibacillus sp. UNCCL117]